MKHNLKISGLRKILRLFFSLISGAAFSYYLNLSTTNMFSLFFAILLYFFYEKAFAVRENKITTGSVFCSLILTIFC
ncbi:MAG: hypothetical protein K2H82_10690, partial [Oscillospiraceae bacterium]|nr:hypothetical protein [Oscillospiraceae bacterium]